MGRILVVLLACSLMLASSALAKGPHVILNSGPEAPEAGEPWEATLELNEFRHAPRPFVVATRGDRSASVDVRRVTANIDRAAGFKTTIVFPTAGRWRILVTAGKRSFRFPAIGVGADEAPQDYVAFPIGSAAAKQGANGIYLADRGALPPEVITAPDEEDGGGVAFWLFPAAGLVLAGAGVAIRRRPRGRRRGSGGPQPPTPR